MTIANTLDPSDSAVLRKTLSRQMHLLEKALGFTLLERNSRSVKLTEARRIYYVDALRILRLADQAIDSARAR